MCRTQWIAVVAAIWAVGIAGCLPATKIVRHPGVDDQGVRYYRPKPYLVIKPLVNKDGMPVSGFVTIDQTIMPDYSEEYSIHVRSGLGVNNTSIKLTEGWNLEALNVELDSQVDEHLTAAADIMKAVPSLTSRDGAAMSGMPVRATNVPLGYYESVISKGCDGTKRLYGFRYVGFMPYAACPIASTGLEQMSCHDGQVYGLVFEGDGMVFRSLHNLPHHEGPDTTTLESQPTPERLPGQDGAPDQELNPLNDGLLDNVSLGARQ